MTATHSSTRFFFFKNSAFGLKGAILRSPTALHTLSMLLVGSLENAPFKLKILEFYCSRVVALVRLPPLRLRHDLKRVKIKSHEVQTYESVVGVGD